MLRDDSGVEPIACRAPTARRKRRRLVPRGRRPRLRRPTSAPVAAGLPLRPLIAEYTATFGSTWAPVTRRKHADDFARFIAWLEANGLPVTTASLDFHDPRRLRRPTCASGPRSQGVWRGAPMPSRVP